MSETYDEKTRLALCVGLAEDLLVDDEVCNANAKSWEMHAKALGQVLREAAADYIRVAKCTCDLDRYDFDCLVHGTGGASD